MAGACKQSPSKAWTHRGVWAVYKSSPRKGLWHSSICYLIIYKDRKPHFVTGSQRDPSSLTVVTVRAAVCCSGWWMHGWAEIKCVLLLPQPGFFSKKMVHCSHWPVFLLLIYMYINSLFPLRIAHRNIYYSSLVPSPFHWQWCPGSWVTSSLFFVLSGVQQKINGVPFLCETVKLSKSWSECTHFYIFIFSVCW